MGAIDRVFRSRRPSQERPLAAIIAGLWRNGEQGVWYDPSDLATMFQDAAGTLPVYAPGQGQVDPPVGLLLDKRLGLVRGPELLTNGGFAAGSASWAVLNTDATHVTTFSAGTMRFQSDTLSPALQVQQVGVMTVGRWYEITVVVSAYTGGSLKTDNLTAAGAGFVIANKLGVQVSVGIAVSSVFAFTRGAVNTDLTIDSISIRELQGNHAFQSTTTSRPTLSARYNLLAATEDFTTGWTAVASSVTANAGAAPDGTLTADRMTRTANYWYLWQAPQVSAGVSYRLSIWVKSATGSAYTFKLFGDGANQLSPTLTANANWQRFEFVFTNGTAGVRQVGVFYPSPTADCDLLIWGADLRVSNDGVSLPEYQRVVDANTYDTVGFPLYLRFDGVDDWLQTAAVDFSGTDKVTIAAAVRKLSDTSAIFVESSPDSSTVNGTFGVNLAPGALAGSIGARLRGTAAAGANASGHASPKSLVAIFAFDIAKGDWGSSMSVRVNRVPQATAQEPAFTAAVGTGNFGSYPLYIGRRGGTSLSFNGRLYSLLIRGGATPDATIAKVERYLNSKARIY